MLDSTPNYTKTKGLTLVQPFSIGVIDLGTNSIRLDIYRVDARLSVTRLFRFKEMIRMGEDVFKRGYIKEEVIFRALTAFDQIHAYLKEYHVTKTVAFATCAMRNSKNAPEFIAKVKARTGITVTVISGREEASLIAKAILNNERTPQGYFGLMDIGGGSTEVSLCYKQQVLDSYSFDLGSIRLHQRFFEPLYPNPSVAAKEAAEKKLREHIRATVKQELGKRKWPKVKTVIGSSGTIRAIWKIFKKSNKAIDPLKAEQISRLVKKLLPLDQELLMDVPGMEEKRADIILPGTILFDELCRCFGCEDAFVTNCSLRDGILDWQIERTLRP